MILCLMMPLMRKIKYSKNYNNEQSLSPFFQTHLNEVLKIIKSILKRRQDCRNCCGKGTFFEIIENYKYVRGFDTSYDGKNKIIKRYVTKKDEINEKLIILRHTLNISQILMISLIFKEISISNPYILLRFQF